ncbi:terminase associated HNH endonuclease [Rhodococcus phage Weasels2]|uniref:Terminase associated HNH endonuclease n=1 Tax=Rhodococcus phage Weasels2 TaxID=1897437 RepID=A0A1I9SA98_9CAUD|nr:HNH endonuclease [Rhodococcus phage Weasels2]AOZ63704.1 terminase associated HNH endonuclease [Rhodococcus phage Weasels2]
MLVFSRAAERIAFLIERDGDKCTFPGCTRKFTNKDFRTTDHIIPVSKGGLDEPENWTLMHQTCNGKKGDRQWIAYGVLEPIPDKVIKPKKEKHKDPCTQCNEGRSLAKHETCEVCGSEPQPKAYPRYAQKLPKECSHSGEDFCWACLLDYIPRKSALETLLTGP